MINGVKTDFDSFIEQLDKLYEDNTLSIANKDIDRYIVPANVQADLGNSFVHEILPTLQIGTWYKLSKINKIAEILNFDDELAAQNKSGIYVIKNDVTNQLYFGKASDFDERLNDHGRAKERDSKFLHAAIRYAEAHPEEKITFSWGIYQILEKNSEILNRAEISAIEKYQTYNNKYDYNLTPGGDGGSGEKFTPEQFEDIKTILRQAEKKYQESGLKISWQQLATELAELWQSEPYVNCTKKSIDRTWLRKLNNNELHIYTADIARETKACIVDNATENSSLNNIIFSSIQEALAAIVQEYIIGITDTKTFATINLYDHCLAKRAGKDTMAWRQYKSRNQRYSKDFKKQIIITRIDNVLLDDGKSIGNKLIIEEDK